MKPDKHKQKRTQQYKKKHGIKDDSPKNDPKNDVRREGQAVGGRGQVPGAGARGAGAGARGGGAGARGEGPEGINNRGTAAAAAGGSSESDQETHTATRPSFRRREITSNWERYTLADKDVDVPDIPESKGADFKALLKASAGAVSQFRFADEKSWDDDIDGSSADFHSLLSIDTNDLAAALDCIPLYRALGVEEEVFEKEDLDLFNQEAAMNRELYLKTRRQQQTSETESQDDNTNTRMEGLDRIWQQSGDILEELTSDLDSINKRQETKVSGLAKESASKNVALDKQEQKTDSPLDNNQIEDDLDKLLSSADSPPAAIVTTNKTDLANNSDSDAESKTGNSEHDQKPSQSLPVIKNTEQTRQSVTNLEDELDMLLSLDNPPSKTSTIPDTDDQNQPKNEDNLEDWLDSVLED